ncbi:MAG TPA: hypothetical protein VIL25_10555 [Vicinamibacterales bacterium]
MRTLCLVTMTWMALGLAPEAGAEPPRLAPFARVRPISREAEALIREGAERSTTIRTMLARIEVSDVIVYVDTQITPRRLVAAWTRFVSSSPVSRVLRVHVDPTYPRQVRLALLGHELRHVIEIVEAPGIRTVEDMLRHYRTHGVETGDNQYDTAAAVETGYIVSDELLRSRGAARLAALRERDRRALSSGGSIGG